MLPKKSRELRSPAGPIPAGRNAVRDAACAFVRGTTSGWSRRDLAEWLVRHYASVATKIEGGGAAPDSSNVDPALLEEVILDARTKTLRLLTDLGFPSLAATRARETLGRGSVARVGDGGHVPVALPRLRLHERVASLFVADWLNFPEAYRAIELCRACGAIGLDHQAPGHDPWCPDGGDSSVPRSTRASA